MIEKRRLLEEETRLNDAAKAADAIAKAFLASEDGMIMVREEAEIRTKRIFHGVEDLLSQ